MYLSLIYCTHCLCDIGCVKMSWKSQLSRPPSSRSVSRQKLHRLTSADTAEVARPPSVFNKIPLLPPIGASAMSLSPGSDSDASVPLGLPTTPAAERWSRAQCSNKLLPKVEDASESSLANSVSVTPNNDDSNTQAACSHQKEHRRYVMSYTPTVESDDKHRSRPNSATATEQHTAASSSLTATESTLGNEPLSQTSRLVDELSTQQSRAKPTDSTASAVTEFVPDCSLSSTKIMSVKGIIELPLVSTDSARAMVTDAACQCDEISSDVKSSESGVQTTDDSGSQLLAAVAGTDDASSSIAKPSSDRTKTADWWSSKELLSASSILGLSPSPSRRLRSGASSRTARKFHGLNAHEMQTMSNVLNTLARSQSRAAGSAAAGAPVTIAGTNTAEPRVPTTERVRLTVSYTSILLAFSA